MMASRRTLSSKGETWQRAFGSSEQFHFLSGAAWWSLNTEVLRGEKTVPDRFLLCLAREREAAFGENTAPMALKQECVLGKQSPWKCDELDLGPDPTW